MTILESIVLGIVQGMTNFFPVSATGHLILTRTLFHVSEVHFLAFDMAIYFATAASVVLYFSADIWLLVQTGLRKLGKLPVNARDQTLLYALLMAMLPAVLVGLTLEAVITRLFSSPLLVALVLVLGSVFFIYAEWKYQQQQRTNEMSIRKGLMLGLYQIAALVPGMSQSGGTIAGGMLLGLSRAEATRFAFLLIVPVAISAGLKDFISMLSGSESIAWTSVIAGGVVATFAGLFAIHVIYSFLRSHTLWPFIWYRIILACFVVFVFTFG